MTPPAPQATSTNTDSGYRITTGDCLLISGNNGISRIIQVDWSGHIPLPNGRKLSVFGRLAEDIASDLGPLLEYKDPTVTVLYARNTFILIGSIVRCPGRTQIPYEGSGYKLISLLNFKKNDAKKGFFRRGNILQEIEISEKMKNINILPDDIVVIP